MRRRRGLRRPERQWRMGPSLGRCFRPVALPQGHDDVGSGYHIEQGDVSYAIVSYDLAGFSPDVKSFD